MAAPSSLMEKIAALVRSDLAGAEVLADRMLTMARGMGDAREIGFAQRASGIVHWSRNRYSEAIAAFEASVAAFEACGDSMEAARTRSNAIQTLIYLSRFQDAMAWANQAREVFELAGDRLRLARLDGNIANLLYRQDRFEESIALYEQVEKAFAAVGQPRDIAAVLRNKAVCQLSLSRFDEALATHAAARSFCLKHEMPSLAVECDYNIAYLHFLRGDYLEALSLYDSAREQAVRCGDRYHQALCDLDQAELYIELNLCAEAQGQAVRARKAFRALGMGYEAAKAEVFLALCAGRLGNLREARLLLARARKHFVSVDNAVWPAVIDLYLALLFYRSKVGVPARRRCLRALGFFSATVLPGKAVQCRLVLARLDLEGGALDAAQAHVDAATRLLPYAQSPALTGHVAHVGGLIRDARGEAEKAAELYRRAEAQFEALRDRLDAEDLRISFFEDKAAVYESHFVLEWLRGDVEEAFLLAERAKSRSLRSATNPRIGNSVTREPDATVGRLFRLRRQLLASELSGGALPSRSATILRDEVRHLEKAHGGMTSPEGASGDDPPTISRTIDALPSETALIEYFSAGGMVYAFVLQRGGAKVYRLAKQERILSLGRFFQFQLSRARRFDVEGLVAASLRDLLAHLRALYAELFAPFHHTLDAKHCVIVPHGALHSLPFHALHTGEGYLGEQYTMSVAPSAAVLLGALRERASTAQFGTLVFGVADALAPEIMEEARAVAELAPNAQLFTGSEATARRLDELGSQAGIIHLATHGKFRRDNPWFSSVRLGDGWLGLYDLYAMRLPAELVVLSGCSTGAGAVHGGDEVVGLVRGLLTAGARAAVVSLWDVNDASSTFFMREFYRRLGSQTTLARALQGAQTATRERYEHPFYWAPFSLVGNFGAWRVKKDVNFSGEGIFFTPRAAPTPIDGSI